MKHVVQFSGGVGSWAAAKRVAERHGTDDLILLFADTLIEDDDLYRFVREAHANVGGELVWISDGRTPWEVFRDVRFIGNSRIDPCSKVLKRDLLRKWVEDNCDPADTVLYVGIDWTESHRMDGKGDKHGIRERMLPYVAEAPLLDAPLLDKRQMLSWLADEGIAAPRLYAMGFPHNNCGGFCVKAGQAQFALLLKMMPDRYAHHEFHEEAMRFLLGSNVSIMRDRSTEALENANAGLDPDDPKYKAVPLTMREFRERMETGQIGMFDQFDWGGCGCALA